MVNEYNNGNTLCIVPVGGTRPTHGDYVLGALLIDENAYPEGGMYKLTSTAVPLTWTRYVNRWNVSRNLPFDGKYGSYVANGMTVRGDGLMADLTALGSTVTVNGMDGSGTSQTFLAGTSVVQNTGISILRPVGSFAGLTRISFTPGYMVRNTPMARSGGDLRYYSGFITTTTGMEIGEAPILQADGGIVVGYNSTDTNFNVWHGDGTNAITKVELTPAVPAPTSTTNLIIEMKCISSTQVYIAVYGGNSLLLLGSKVITTNLPAAAKTLNWQNVIQNPTLLNKQITMYSANMETFR